MQATLDSEIVSWIGRLGAAGVRHVMARFGISRKWAFDRLTPLVRDGLLTQHRLLHGRPGLYVATRKGLRWGGLTGLRVFTITPSRFEHAWQIADVAVAVARGLPDWLVLSDREILRHERQQRELLASVRVGSRGGGVAALHRPDLALISPRGRVVAVEIELSLKRRSSLVAICGGWARARHVDAVYYLATAAPTRGVGWAAKKTRAEGRLKILPLGQTAEIVRLEREAAAGGDDEHR